MQVSTTGFSAAADEGHVRKEIHRRELITNLVRMSIIRVIGVLKDDYELTRLVNATKVHESKEMLL